MSARLGRRTFTQRAGAIAMAATLPMPAIAQDKPVKIGLLTVKTGPLAQGGLQMEQGINLFLKHRGGKLAGRKAELVVGDTGGNPAGTKTKAQELIERDKSISSSVRSPPSSSWRSPTTSPSTRRPS